MSDEYVKRESVKEWLLRWEGYIDMDIIARMQYRVIDIPAADPPEKCIAEIHADKEMVTKWINEALQNSIVHCKDCRWGREACGNIECSADLNLPPEYHGYDWFCPNGERRSDG